MAQALERARYTLENEESVGCSLEQTNAKHINLACSHILDFLPWIIDDPKSCVHAAAILNRESPVNCGAFSLETRE